MPAITTAATFVMSGPEEVENEPLYGRYGNPSRNSVEAILASLEGAKHNALCFSSGMNTNQKKLSNYCCYLARPTYTYLGD